ncbi:MAG: D-alanyl-D-alanine carboxypeptidase family protein [Actinomycetota bacterium]|nr:D-alanyl-D-alanine carboxypeptidase family protein [Actinomycetota bacterium]
MSRRTLATTLTVVVALSLSLPALASPGKFPVRVQDGFPMPEPPAVTAAAWVLFDESMDQVLASQAVDEERAMASTTKIMTGLLAIERGSLDDLVVVSENAAGTGEREIDLVAGETLTLDALLKAAMIHSANDAATAIAEHIGGSVEGFVDMMNERAQELGLTETSFANPHGLDAPEHHSSANDLLELARVAMSHQGLADIVRSRIVVFPDAPDGTKRIGTTTNLMLGSYDGAGGIKTGFTAQALLTFVATAERDGRRLYAVVLGSDGSRAHFADATALFDYGFTQLRIVGTVASQIPYASVQGRVSPSPLVATANIETFVHLAGQGLVTDPPTPPVAVPEPTPLPISVVNRHPGDSPEDLWTSMSFWWKLVQGG